MADEKPHVYVPPGEAPPTELQIVDVTEGDGAVAEAGREVEVHYVGKAWSTRQEFDASWNRGEPFRFTLGEGRVIKGWDQGVVGMKVGGRRQLTIPPNLAYGKAGSGSAIRGGETLVFVVDLLAVTG
jgi:peptidylprolyl isomerase